MRSTALSLVTLSLLCACGGSAAGPTPSASRTDSLRSTAPSVAGGRAAPPPPTGAAASSAPGSVFVLVMENKTLGQALSGRYTAALASHALVATNYHAVGSPSTPNYLALTSGSTWDITANVYRSLPGPDLGAQLTSAHIPWRAYMEDMGADCRRDNGSYVVKHNPFAFFGARCSSNVVPLARLDADLRGQTPRFVWITPNLCHDQHDCSVAEGDAWLSSIVPTITASAAFRNRGLLAVVWDESGEGRDNTALLLLQPGAAPGTTDTFYTHYSLLATVESRLGLGRLGAAAGAAVIPEAAG